MSRNNEVLLAERRRFLRLAVAGGTALVIGGGFALPRLLAAGVDEGLPGLIHTEPGSVLLEIFADNGRDLGARRLPRRLSPASFEILRRGGTEPAFSGQHERSPARGLFRCAGCATALYDDATQFD